MKIIEVGHFAEFSGAVVRQLPRDLTAAQAQYWIERQGELSEALRKALIVEKDAVRQPERPKSIRERFPNARVELKIVLVLDYGVSQEDTLRATECAYMLEHCPPWNGTGKVEVEANLIDMGADFERDDALQMIHELGLRVAPDNAALLTLSRVHSNLQRDIWVVDPETVWPVEGGCNFVACISGRPDEYDGCLVQVRARWDRTRRVLALSKSK